MHYYQFHIGDYRAATAHLSNEEDLAYRRLLDMYYDTEQPISTDVQQVSRRIRCDKNAIETVLNDFFQSTPDGWEHRRCIKEITHFHSKVEQASRAGRASAQRRLNGRSTGVQPTNNHKPITNNQIKKEAQPAVDLPDWLDKETWTALVDMRKRIKKPMTDHAQKLMLGKLYRMKEAGHDIKAIMEKTIVNSWLDVYEPKVVQQVSRNSYESLL